MKIYRTINRKTLPLLTLGLVLTSIFIPILSPRVSAVFVKGNGEAIYHATLNPDVPNVIVEAVRQAPYAGQANTYTLHMTGSTYSSDSSGNNVIKVPSSCNTSSDFNMAKFIIRVSISNGGTLINGTTTVIGQSSGVGKCGGDEYNVNVAVKDTSSISTVGSICGVLSYVDPSSGKTKPYQPNSTVKLSGASTATTNTDANGSYCFYSLSAGNYNIDAAYAYQDANGLPAQAKFTKKNIALATSQNLVINDTFDLVGLNKTAATPKDPGTTPTCESTGLSLAWIVCPFVNGLADAIDGIYGGFIKPLLITKPIDVSGTKKCQSSDSFKGCDYMIWSEFRVYGNILLIIALLVIVFGQSIGGGLVDAYTAKKVLPRLLAASILINLSIYIVAFMVDITNIIGGGIQSLLTLPFTDHSAFHLTLNGGAAGTLATLGLGALLGAAGSIWLAITEPGILLSIAGPLVSFLALFILLPGILIFVAILGTVIIRRGLIIFLILISPVAFALYCLPNTEKYFKKWWELLLKTLLVYPIIALVFTISDIFAVTISQGGNTSGLVSWAAQLISVAALILPLFLIPFSFKLAGGFIGRLHDLASGMRKRGQETIKGNANNQFSLRNKTKRNMSNMVVDRRAGLQNITRNKRGLSTIGRIAGGGAGTFDRQAQHLKETAGMMEVTSTYGNDAFQKASTITKANMKDWKTTGSSRYRVKDGVEQWATADGAFYDKQQINEGRRANSSEAQRQRSFALVAEKAKMGTRAQQDNVLNDFMDYATEAGLDEETAQGRWQGIAIPYKGTRIDLRRAVMKKGADGVFRRPTGAAGLSHAALLTEVGGSQPGELAGETYGAAEAIESSIMETVFPTNTPGSVRTSSS